MTNINLNKLHKRSTQKLIYENYSPKMMGLCMRYASSNAEAEDLLHDGFIKAFKNINKFSGNGNIEGWLRRVIINNTLDTIRLKNKEIRNLKIMYDTHKDDYAEPNDTNINDFSNCTATQLVKIIQKLPTVQRTIFNLYVIEDYSHLDIAKELNITVGSSKSSYFKARKNLIKYLKEI